MTKKRLITVIATLMVALWIVDQATAQDNYGIKINGQEVTSGNAIDLATAIKGVEGLVQYIQPLNALILINAHIDADENQIGIESNCEGLTIQIEGDCSIITEGKAGVLFNNIGAFSGNGTLTITSRDNYGVAVNNVSLLATSCKIHTTGLYGIAGLEGSNNASLSLNGATIEAEGARGSICNFASLSLVDSKIAEPRGAVWNPQKRAVCDTQGQILTERVLINPVVYYPLSIAGEQVNDVNYSTLSNLPGVQGSITYDSSTKTLTLKDATIASPTGGSAIISDIPDLNIHVEGVCTIESKQAYVAVGLFKSATIMGKGSLSIKSEEDSAILLVKNGDLAGDTDPSLTVKDCTLYLSGQWGILGHTSTDHATLTIDNASVTAYGYGASISGLADCTLKDCSIVSPEGAVWDSSKRAICDNLGNVIKDEIFIKANNPIDNIAPIQNDSLSIIAIYSIDGTHRDKLSDGVNIVVYSDGTSKAVIQNS